MSYYILPKINNGIRVTPKDDLNNCKVYISNSLLNYYTETKTQLINMCLNDPDTSNKYNEFVKIINPYEYIFSIVPNSKFSVSKLKPNSFLFYDLLEIITTMNVFESNKNKNIKILNVGSYFNDVCYSIEMMREFNKDIFFTLNDLNELNNDTFNKLNDQKFDFLFFDSCVNLQTNDINNYFTSLIQIIMIILKQNNEGSICLIKINHIFYKPIIDSLYLLSSLFEKVYIIKPNPSNIISFDKYIVCKNYQVNKNNLELCETNYLNLSNFLLKLNNKNITSLIEYDIPYYFINKLDELNNIMGQQQLESIDHLINVLKNKNKDEKIETIKKINIQRSVVWCEKFKIPCNKFTDKTNIFLPIIKEKEDEEEKEFNQEDVNENIIT